MTPLPFLSIPIAALFNIWRGEDKPTGSEQVNRILFGLAIASPFAFAGLWMEFVIAAIGGFLGMLLPHGSWLGYKYWTDRLYIFGVCLIRGALVASPIGLWASVWVALFSGIAGLVTLELGHLAAHKRGHDKVRADIIWHAGWASFTAAALIVGIV